MSRVEKTYYRGREYLYLFNPITSGVSPIDPNHLSLIADLIGRKIDGIGEFDYILTYEAMGIHIATLIAERFGKPFIIARKKRYTSDMIEVKRRRENLYIPEDVTESKIIIVDSIISTGETIVNTFKALASHGVEVKGIYSFINRIDQGGSRNIYIETGIKPYSIVEVIVKPGDVEVSNINL